MSFFRNIRSSITRGKSSSRDESPVRSSRAGSIASNATGRRDSVDSRTDSIFNRSDTFIIGSDTDDKQNLMSPTPPADKKTKKLKMLSKFSTFTKRKKPPSSGSGAYEHHPSDNATNTYYKWKAEGGGGGGTSTLTDYDASTDPFNFLYEQQSSLKAMQNGNSASEPKRVSSPTSTSSGSFDSSTYKKDKMPTQLKEQLLQLKSQTSTDLHEEGAEAESDKYKTVTLSSFRKSFRDKFLQQQKDVPYNPAWFVEVDEPATASSESYSRADTKENRPDVLVFENDNYRPHSRSPVRERNGQASRSSTRSPVKRNDTFRVDRLPPDDGPASPTDSSTSTIRIEIKNSITPITPVRMVPVGVAMPMPSPHITARYQPKPSSATSKTRISNSPPRSVYKPKPISPSRQYIATPNRNTNGRYQTLIQIRGEPPNNMKPLPSSTAHYTRSRLGGMAARSNTSSIPQKSINSFGTRYHDNLTTPGLSSYELLRQAAAATSKAHKSNNLGTKHTYFGDAQQQPRSAYDPSARYQAQPQLQHYTQPTVRSSLMVSTPRRSRSPIKMPWR